jgi:hypothetical protein
MNAQLAELPIVTQFRQIGSSSTFAPKTCHTGKIERVERERRNIRYIKDADEDCVYFVSYGGVPAVDSFDFAAGKILKIGDKIIFNGTDEYGFDMGTISYIGKDDFQIEYTEFTNSSALRKCRNLNRLPTPDDFSKKPIYIPVNDWNVHNEGKARILTMKFKKFDECEERRWFVVIHSLLEEEYEEVCEQLEQIVGPFDDETDDDADEEMTLHPNYHCHRCRGETPIERERCRRMTENSASSAYEIAAVDAYNGEGKYTNQPTITTWRITIKGICYLIDYNNVLFSPDGEVLGYAIPSNTQGLEGFDEPFVPYLFNYEDEERQSPPPPEYPLPPKYER